MAFQQPARQAVQRPLQDEADDRESHVPSNDVNVLPADGSQTWVLFSPRTETATTTGTPSVLDSLPASSSQQTAGRSRLSDLGSLQSLNPSNYASSYAQSTYARPSNLRLSLLTSALSHAQDGNDHSVAVMGDGRPPDAEDDAELDSLDSHLPDFRATQTTGRMAVATTAPVEAPATATAAVNLPTHDGLGSFRLGEGLGVSASVLQEHLYAFEQFNPKRVTKRRRESLDLAQLQAENEFVEDLERTRRIEAWRLEHSRVLLEEIQKETRRRRGSDLSARRNRSKPTAVSPTTDAMKPGAGSAAWHDQEVDERLLQQLRGATGEEAEKDGLWSQLTRKFILEVMGIDDRLLSVLFGEALADDVDDLSSTPKAPSPLSAAAGTAASTATASVTAEAAAAAAGGETGSDESSSSWQMRMLERIAKELGMFMHSHLTAHPGAFSTFTQLQQMPLPYAGLPVIPESMTPPNRDGVLLDDVHGAQQNRGAARVDDVAVNDGQTPTGTTASFPLFQPTIHQAQPVDKGTGPSAASTSASTLAAPPATTAAGFTQEEWEQDLDIKLVFRYLRSRFFSGASSSSSHAHRHHRLGSSGSGSLTMQDAAAKAARVRQHHPLVGRNAARQAGDRRSVAPTYRSINPAVATPSSPLLGLRAATSCASQSTRRSARRSSVSSRHSSRHYWDIGGSIGTGSVIASVGPMGSWGEL